MKTILKTVVLVTLAAAGAASAQSGQLYVSSGNGSGWWHMQGGNNLGNWQSNPPYAPAIIGNSIRAFGGNSGDTGREYDLNGNDLGPNYQNNTGTGYFFDGTTDGKNYNYAINWSAGEVWRFDTNWQSGQFLFDTPDLTAGITYDTRTGHIWTNNGRLGRGTDELREYDTSGNLLNTYGYNVGDDTMGLAYDATDDSLYIFNYSGVNQIYQFNTVGQQIGTINTPFAYGIGAEFANAVPAPGAAALLGLSGLIATRRSR